jgi:hypothetical protein
MTTTCGRTITSVNANTTIVTTTMITATSSILTTITTIDPSADQSSNQSTHLAESTVAGRPWGQFFDI